MIRTILLLLGLWCLPVMVFADQPQLSRAVYEALQQVQTQIEAKQYTQAAVSLRRLQQEELSGYEVLQLWQLWAQLHYLNGERVAAAKAYEKLLGMSQLQPAMAQRLRLQLAQLRFQLADYAAVNRVLSLYLQQQKQPTDAVLLLQAQAYYHRDRFKEATKPLRRVISRARAQQRVPAENTLLLLQAVYHQLADYKAMLPLLKQLARHYPKRDYLLRLAAVYSELGQSRQQLNVMAGLYARGQLTQRAQLRNLVSLHLKHKAPRAAAKVLQQAIAKGQLKDTSSNQRLLAQAWRAAKAYRKAIPPLQRAAQGANDAALYLQLGYLHSELQEWKDALQALDRAVQHGNATQRARAQLLMGVALIQREDYAAATQALQQAATDPARTASAKQWLAYIEQLTLVTG